MSYDSTLAERLAERLDARPGYTSKSMFGARMWWYHGHILCGAAREGLLLRVAPETAQAHLQDPGVTAFTPGSRPIKGWLVIALEEIDSDEALDRWIALALAHAKSLPPKG